VTFGELDGVGQSPVCEAETMINQIALPHVLIVFGPGRFRRCLKFDMPHGIFVEFFVVVYTSDIFFVYTMSYIVAHAFVYLNAHLLTFPITRFFLHLLTFSYILTVRETFLFCLCHMFARFFVLASWAYVVFSGGRCPKYVHNEIHFLTWARFFLQLDKF
jgi:hypothetical protein